LISSEFELNNDSSERLQAIDEQALRRLGNKASVQKLDTGVFSFDNMGS